MKKTAESKINLFDLGILCSLRIGYWTARTKNKAAELNLTIEDIQDRAIVTYGTKDLIDSVKGRKVFCRIDSIARKTLYRYSHPFYAVNAFFVPWKHVDVVITELAKLKEIFSATVEVFMNSYEELKKQWLLEHRHLNANLYPSPAKLRGKFYFVYSLFEVNGIAQLTEQKTAERLSAYNIKQESLKQLESTLQLECNDFIQDYVQTLHNNVAALCDTIVEKKGLIKTKTFNSISKKLEALKEMNIFNDVTVDAQIKELKEQLGLYKEIETDSNLADKIAIACSQVKDAALNPDTIKLVVTAANRKIVLD